jgi:hypothetical protein
MAHLGRDLQRYSNRAPPFQSVLPSIAVKISPLDVRVPKRFALAVTSSSTSHSLGLLDPILSWREAPFRAPRGGAAVTPVT